MKLDQVKSAESVVCPKFKFSLQNFKIRQNKSCRGPHLTQLSYFEPELILGGKGSNSKGGDSNPRNSNSNYSRNI